MRLSGWIVAAFAPVALMCGGAGAAAADGPAAEEPLNLGRMTPGYSYFNRPGADRAAHDKDVATCLAKALNVRSAQERFRNSSLGLLPALIDGLRANSANRGVVSAALENCMVVHGWRVVSLDEAEGKALVALPGPQLSERLAPWIGAADPHGRVGRIWHNDAALATVNHFSLHANHTKDGQLSLLAIETNVSTAIKGDNIADAAAPKLAPVKLDSRWPRKQLKPETLDSAPAFAGILIVNVNGVSMRQGNGFTFSRVGTDTQPFPALADGAPGLVRAGLGAIAASKDGKFFAFAVPPGRWRINSIFGGMLELNFCLGSPVFDVKAGEVVYAGELDLKQDRLMPDFDMAPLKAWMGTARAAERVRPAEYRNGSTGPCGGTNIYALEFDGLPFEPGYTLGSTAQPEIP